MVIKIEFTPLPDCNIIPFLICMSICPRSINGTLGQLDTNCGYLYNQVPQNIYMGYFRHFWFITHYSPPVCPIQLSLIMKRYYGWVKVMDYQILSRGYPGDDRCHGNTHKRTLFQNEAHVYQDRSFFVKIPQISTVPKLKVPLFRRFLDSKVRLRGFRLLQRTMRVRVETDGDNSLRENCHSRAKHTMTIITNCHETLNRL